MITQQAQIKLNLPLALKEFLESKASKFDMPVAAYLKHLVLKDVENMEYPTFEASDKTVKAYKKAMRDIDKAIEITDIDEFFKKL